MDYPAPQIKIKSFCSLVFIFLLFGGVNLNAQEKDTIMEKDTRPVKNTFESNLLIDNQTVLVPIKGTFEMDFQHRFGLIEQGYDDFWGLFANSNIRLGFTYVPIERLQIGFGITKAQLHWDFNAKYAILQQGRSGGSPISLTYYGDMAIDTRNKSNFDDWVDRYSYFNQLMIARKISKSFSVQVSGNLSYVNDPPRNYDEEQVYLGVMHNAHISASILGRYKITDMLGIIVHYDQPLSNHDVEAIEPEPNLSFGLEITTSSHCFQIFAGNYQYILGQLNNTQNKNKIGDGDFAIGFNITRLWNY